ncbi:competence protein ComK [Fervidibacillus halotolerans]|uniref:Competence protein ComK n=1 Tax=Fervidibacillus halotolerans TaxID=2980027 RepID=A0A9E8M1X5_9BACI|nr:competence protein ComK [Fervidibacillus halotolerans]WAA13462.1 competence protein ComK [Fervidibacillus halotolerans]
MKDTILPLLENQLIITEFTYAIQPVFEGEYQSIIYSEHGLFYSQKKPLTLIKDACDASFSTFEERRRMIIREFRYNFRVPIPVSLEHDIFAFPTEAIQSPFCEWYFVNNIVNIIPAKGGSKVIFLNGSSVTTSIPVHLLIKQLERASRCMTALKNYRKMMKFLEEKKNS